MGTRVRGWRWRPNPLRRRSDVVEVWTTLFVTVLLFVGAPLAGVIAGSWAHSTAGAEAAEQRAGLHRVRAVLVADAPAAPTTHGGRQPTYFVKARWTDPADGLRTGTARVPAGTRSGESAHVWLDARGRSVGPPPTRAAVQQHAVAFGATATCGAVAVVLAGHLVVRRVALRRRLAGWEREWARTRARVGAPPGLSGNTGGGCPGTHRGLSPDTPTSVSEQVRIPFSEAVDT